MERLMTLASDKNNLAYSMESQPFGEQFYYAFPLFDFDSAKDSHPVLGFGASFTDAASYVVSRMDPAAKEKLLHDLFDADKLNLSMIRLNVGSSDYATEVYSYDDTPDDFAMEHFSIAHDEAYLIPLMRKVKSIRPDVFFFSSPWSPPAWMKTSHSMCGGYMRAKYLPAFADYYVKYLQAYRAAGIEIDAVTMQNESETEQLGTMPQSLLHPDFEAELVGHLLPPRLKAAGLHAKMWLHDHNYNGWNRVMGMLEDPAVLDNTDAIAFHPYGGTPDMTAAIREKYPHLHFQLTEKGPNLNPDSPESTILWWIRTITDALNCGCGSFVGWNFALDENGMPNTGAFHCAGLVTVHSRTGEVIPSMQYHAFRHFAPFMKRGGTFLSVPCSRKTPGIDFTACRNPDGSFAVVAANHESFAQSIQIRLHGKYLRLLMRPESVQTLCLEPDVSL